MTWVAVLSDAEAHTATITRLRWAAGHPLEAECVWPVGEIPTVPAPVPLESWDLIRKPERPAMQNFSPLQHTTPQAFIPGTKPVRDLLAHKLLMVLMGLAGMLDPVSKTPERRALAWASKPPALGFGAKEMGLTPKVVV